MAVGSEMKPVLRKEGKALWCIIIYNVIPLWQDLHGGVLGILCDVFKVETFIIVYPF